MRLNVTKLLKRTGCAAMAAMFMLSSVPVYAEPLIVEDSEQEVIDPEAVDDEEAIDSVNDRQRNHELADAQRVSAYLLNNAQDEVIKQIPTDDHDESLPSKFDLRDQGVVTPVKLQNPWGTCWGFAAIAACETSILSKMGKTYEETGLDLSEHHLTYFSKTYLTDGSSQDGEGVHMYDESGSLDLGGVPFTACSLFSSGIGPVSEELVPYRGKKSETDHMLFFNFSYSGDDDWTLPDECKFMQQYNLTDSSVLLSPAVYEFEDGADESDPSVREESYVGYDASATDTIKKELMSGRAVSIGFASDTYLPEQLSSDGIPMYLNTEDNKWTHYTFDGATASHAVTIVGWDDSVKSTDFLDHSNDEYGDGKAHQPEGDGAWIVKNSWGAGTSGFPNCYDWGITDEEGNGTGYFYISYYDRSICFPESFTFDLTEHANNAIMIDQYDYMPTNGTEGWADNNGLQMANVFTAEADGNITAVSCQTNSENISTTYQVFLLDNDAVTPDDGELAATVTADYAHSGYHKALLDEPVPVEKGQRYSVIVTSCFTDGENLYYEFLTSTAENKETCDEYNRKILYSHRGDPLDKNTTPEEAYADELQPYYSVGIVNEGESFVYANALGQWADLSQIVPYLQQDEKYEGNDFDNFPVKAYLEFDNASDAEAVTVSVSDASDLDFAEPAGEIYAPFLLKCLLIMQAAIVGIAVIVLIIVLIVKSAKRKKMLVKKCWVLEAENAELKRKLAETSAGSDAVDSEKNESADNA